MSKIECVVDGKNQLGEGAVWDAEEAALFWVDIRGPRIHKLDPASGATEAWDLPSAIGSFALRRGTSMLLALQSGLHLFDRATGKLEPIGDPEADLPNNRFNDGKCDRQGRFWVGTMRDDEGAPSGALYRVDADRSCHRQQSGIAIPNSLAWSPDGDVMKFTDTADGRILAYEYDAVAGLPGAPRVLVGPDGAPGHPDGSTVDESGCLWNARYAGGCVARFRPDGGLDRVIELPASQVTCCAFGGPALDSLFITTATQNLSAPARAKEPLAGGLFAVDVEVKGVPEPRFAG